MSVLFVLLFCHLTYNIHADVHTRRLLNIIPPQGDTKVEEVPGNVEDQAVVVDVSKKEEKSKLQTKVEELLPDANQAKNASKPIKNETKIEEHKILKTTEMESGALLRGVAVVVVLTMIVIIYMALKTYCGKRIINPIMVSKYGVRTRRSDIEMTPLPLDEDEDDETLFEVNPNR